jgi:hypothetical protein
MLAKSNQTTATQRIIEQLVDQAEMEDFDNRRAEGRYPFFRAVSVQMGGHSFPAFTRYISASGIGLTHNMELPLCEVELNISDERGRAYNLRGRIEWCEPRAGGWYISGVAFI